MNRRERLAQRAQEKKTAQARQSKKESNLVDPQATAELIKHLEPILLGLITGTKKLVIEQRIHGDQNFGEFDYTVKVKDCSGDQG